MADLEGIKGFHAHVYFGPDTVDQANAICQQAGEKFSSGDDEGDLNKYNSGQIPFRVGRMHHRPVGPHPCWSCQLAFGPEQFASVIPWLALHRQGLTVFIHPETGDDLKDHTDHAIWMGTIEPLNLDALK